MLTWLGYNLTGYTREQKFNLNIGYTAGNAKYRQEGVRRSSGFYEHDDQADFYHTHTGGGQNRGHRMSEDYFRAAAAVLERRGSVACDDRWASWGSRKNQ